MASCMTNQLGNSPHRQLLHKICKEYGSSKKTTRSREKALKLNLRPVLQYPNKNVKLYRSRPCIVANIKKKENGLRRQLELTINSYFLNKYAFAFTMMWRRYESPHLVMHMLRIVCARVPSCFFSVEKNML